MALEKALGGKIQRMVALILAADCDTALLSVDPEQGGPARYPDGSTSNSVVDAEPTECSYPDKEPVAGALQYYKGRPLIAYAYAAASQVGVTHVMILAAYDLMSALKQALDQEQQRLLQSGVTAVPYELQPYDTSEEQRILEQSAWFEVQGYSRYLVQSACSFCAEHSAQAAFVLSAIQPLITGDHLQELCEGFTSLDACDIGVTWLAALRRLPFLIPANLDTRLEAAGLYTKQAHTGYRPAPNLSVYELDLGGKKLMTRKSPQATRKTFVDDITLSALQAVRLAKESDDKRTKTLESLNEADTRLAQSAVSLLKKMAPSTKREAQLLSAADHFGHRCKGDFPLFQTREHSERLVYLDTAATAQRLGRALQAQYDFDTHSNANVYRSIYGLSKSATAAFREARECIAHVIGADVHQVIVTSNTTAGCSLVATSWGNTHVHKGDVIVLWSAEHHSNLLPWKMLTQRTGAEVIMLPLDGDGRIDREAYQQALDRKPVLVCCAHIGNVMGMVNPIEEMAQQAHKVGARFMLDASQSFAHVPIDVGQLGVDFMAFCAHKAYGPMGIGALWVSPEVVDQMEPLSAGGGSVAHVDVNAYRLLPAPYAFEGGTPPVSLAIGMASAVGYLQELGFADIQNHDSALTRYLVRGLRAIPGVTVFGDHTHEDGWAGIVSYTLQGIDATGLVQTLDALGVAVRGGGHCAMALSSSLGVAGTVRSSLGVYNTAEDIEAAVVAIETCRQSLQERVL